MGVSICVLCRGRVMSSDGPLGGVQAITRERALELLEESKSYKCPFCRMAEVEHVDRETIIKRYIQLTPSISLDKVA